MAKQIRSLEEGDGRVDKFNEKLIVITTITGRRKQTLTVVMNITYGSNRRGIKKLLKLIMIHNQEMYLVS